MPHLISVNVGLPRDIGWQGQTVHTGIWKLPVSGRVNVRRLNVDGDSQGDLAGHGGEYRAVLVYQLDSYRYWERELGRNDFSNGQFGENFTVEGMADSEVCIGDRYRIGTATFEVTQPRVTCYRLGIRMKEPRMAALLVAHHRPGFYFRVIEEGSVGAGDEIVKTADGPEGLTIEQVDALLYLPGHERKDMERALRIPALSPGWRVSFEAMLAQGSGDSGNAGLVASAPPPAWKGFRTLTVGKVVRESTDVLSLSFVSPDGVPLPPALPGQFLVLKLRIDANRPAILRNYSISGRSGESGYRVSVKREAQGIASAFIHETIVAGDSVEVSAPRGVFTLRPGGKPVVLLSAGIGATPVIAMLQALAAEASPREVWWLYGARNREEHPFAEESRGLLRELARGHSYIVYSQPGAGDRAGDYYDAAGHLDAAALTRSEVASDADFYLCGPSRFMAEMTLLLQHRNVPRAAIHTENFGPEPGLTPGIEKFQHQAAHPPVGTAGNGLAVAFTRSGITVPWDSRFGSLLDLAEACDVPVKWSCRTGVCHNCESALIGGAVDYFIDPLDPPADGNVLICCSRPRTGVELDL